MQKNKSELLIPAGSLLKLKTAILYGADAVYAGTPDLSMRTQSKFTLEELIEGIEYVHKKKKKIYLALNLYTHNKDIEKLPEYLKTIKSVNPDGLIIADPGVFQYVKEHAPNLPLHISTQANVLSWLTVKFWQNLGAELCVLGREVTFEELKEIRKKCPDIKLEAFIHGAMCMSYSGRCLISNFLAERGANQGNCAHCCRWSYKIHLRLKDGSLKEIEINQNNKELFEILMEEDFRPGEFIPIEELERSTYIMNSKDLCLMPKLNKYLHLGIESLKIEGRNKTNYYNAIATHTYRRAIDDYYRDPENWNFEKYMPALNTLQNRGYTLAFHDGRLTDLSHNYLNGKSISEYENAGYIKKWQNNEIIFEVKNTLNGGDLIEFISPYLDDPIRLRLAQFIDIDDGLIKDKISPGQNKAIRIPISIFESLNPDQIKKTLPELTVARKKIIMTDEDKKRHLLDLEVFKAEITKKDLDPAKKAQIIKEIEEDKEKIKNRQSRPTKAPKMGTEACCGKGCNGCAIFWNDPKFKKAHEELQQKGIGGKL